jgi:1-acyl-sn-glycerol-3-phosphate acyltransferase
MKSNISLSGRLAKFAASQRFWLTYFILTILLVGAPGCLLSLPLLALGRIYPPAHRAGSWLFAKGVAVLMAVQPWLNGFIQIAVPKTAGGQGVLYVGNHRSTLDVYFLLAHIQGIRVLAKKSLLYVPFLGAVMVMTRQILVQRQSIGNSKSYLVSGAKLRFAPETFPERGEGSPRIRRLARGFFLATLVRTRRWRESTSNYLKAMQTVETALAAGENVHIFPEYTRCPKGFVGTQKFALAPFQIALKTRALVVPIVFKDTDLVWSRGFWGLNARHRVRVYSLPPVDGAQFDNPRALLVAVQTRIDAELQRDIGREVLS